MLEGEEWNLDSKLEIYKLLFSEDMSLILTRSRFINFYIEYCRYDKDAHNAHASNNGRYSETSLLNKCNSIRTGMSNSEFFLKLTT